MTTIGFGKLNYKYFLLARIKLNLENKFMILSFVWGMAALILAYLCYQNSKSHQLRFIEVLRLAMVRHSAKEDWLGILFLVFLIFAPLVIGFTFYLQSDANVVVVLAFLIWTYQWIKAIWNSSLETE
ncbi:MAG: hypothetical protein CK427_12510 [Leptospira sp.]|nr:MAG: hypothetical protein CK427_12510 [Leptospira sp.]